MARIGELLDAELDEGDLQSLAPMPATRISQRIATSTGADRHVAIRSLAEQLVCEANAVMAGAAGHVTQRLDLSDETLPSELAFDVRYGGRAVRVSTTFADGAAYGRLVGDGFESELPRELADADDLPDLIVRLVAEADRLHSH